MPPKRRRRFQGLYYHSSPPKVLPMNDQSANQNGRRRRDVDEFSIKLSTIRIWMHEKEIGKLARILWAGQGNRLRQQASTNPRVKRFLAAVPYVMNAIKDVHQAVIENNLETLQAKLEPPVPAALVTGKDANGLNVIHKAAGLGHTKILEYLISIWPEGANEMDITGKTPLHWAASAKNNMRCYTLLTQAGCDEEAVDYKSKTPSYYRHKPNEIERAFLVYVPDAPRVSPDILTDFEALNDDTNSDKKFDAKVPLTNGIIGRTTINDSTNDENFSEADLNDGSVSATDETELPKSEPENANADHFNRNNSDPDGEKVNATAPVTPAVDDSHQDEGDNADGEEKSANEINEINDGSEKSEHDVRNANTADDGDSVLHNGVEGMEAEKDTSGNVDIGSDIGVRGEEDNEKAGEDQYKNDDFENDDEENRIEEKEREEEKQLDENENINEEAKNPIQYDKQQEVKEKKLQEEDDEETAVDNKQDNKEKLEINIEIGNESSIEAAESADDELLLTNDDDETEKENEEKIENANVMFIKENDLNNDSTEIKQSELEQNKAIQQDVENVEDTHGLKDLENKSGQEEKKIEKFLNKGNDTDSSKSCDKDVEIIKTKADNNKSSDESADEDEDVVAPDKDSDHNNIKTAETGQTIDDNQTIDSQNDEDDVISNDKLDENHNNGSRTSSLAIEGFVHGDSEDNTVQSQSAALYDEV